MTFIGDRSVNALCLFGFHKMRAVKLEGPIEAWFTNVTRQCIRGCGRTRVGLELSRTIPKERP